jgi:hypothetical protein
MNLRDEVSNCPLPYMSVLDRQYKDGGGSQRLDTSIGHFLQIRKRANRPPTVHSWENVGHFARAGARAGTLDSSGELTREAGARHGGAGAQAMNAWRYRRCPRCGHVGQTRDFRIVGQNRDEVKGSVSAR